MTKPLVSICIPTYNGSVFLQEALDSVKKQTYAPIEVIVSDDDSKDNTLEIVNKFKNEVNFPVTIFSHKPKGIGANWNNSVKHAKGEYIKFLFQDDVLYPNCIERMVTIAKSGKNVGMVYCKRDIIFDKAQEFERRWVKNFSILHQSWHNLNVNEGVLSGKEYLKDGNLLEHPSNKIGEPPAVLLHKSCFKKIGYFDEKLKQALDIEYWYRLLIYFNIGFVDEALIKFRLHDNQASQINAKYGTKDRRILPILQLKLLFWHVSSNSKKLIIAEIWRFSRTLILYKKVKRKLRKFNVLKMVVDYKGKK